MHVRLVALAATLPLVVAGCGGEEASSSADQKIADEDLRRICSNIEGIYKQVDQGAENFRTQRAGGFETVAAQGAAALPNITEDAPQSIRDEVPAAVAALEQAARQFEAGPFSTDLESVAATRQRLSSACTIAFMGQ